MLKYLNIYLILLIVVVFVKAESPLHLSEIGDFKLENGQIIKDCKIGYRTFGKLNADSSNVIIYPTWFSGTTAQLKGLCTKKKIVDSTKYFIIGIAALGNGESSSPSNSKLQPGKKFPQFTIRDMVQSQYKMLKKEFGFKKIYAVVGGSMGAMQGYEWLIQYPAFMDKAVLYVGSPKLTSSDLLYFKVLSNIIRMNSENSDSVWAIISALTKFKARTTEYVSTNTSPEEVNELWKNWLVKDHPAFTLEDYTAQTQAMCAQDIFKSFSGNKEQTAKVVKAKVLQIISKTDQLVNHLPAKDFGNYIDARTILLEGNCGHLEPGCQMREVSAAIQTFLN